MSVFFTLDFLIRSSSGEKVLFAIKCVHPFLPMREGFFGLFLRPLPR